MTIFWHSILTSLCCLNIFINGDAEFPQSPDQHCSMRADLVQKSKEKSEHIVKKVTLMRFVH